jgi:hypothetical protein
MFYFDVLSSAALIQLTVNTIGPFGLFDKIRDRWGHDSWLGMFHCAWCMSVWASAMVMALGGEWSVVRWLSIAFLSGLMAWAVALVQDLLSELVQYWRRS